MPSNFYKLILMLSAAGFLSASPSFAKINDDWNKYDSGTVECSVAFITQKSKLTKEQLLSVSPTHEKLIKVVKWCESLQKEVRENFKCKAKSKKTGKLIDRICSQEYYSKVDGKIS